MGCCKQKEESCACAEINESQESCGCACSDTPDQDMYDLMCMYRKLSDLLDEYGPVQIVNGLVIYTDRASQAAESKNNPQAAEAWALLSERLSEVLGD